MRCLRVCVVRACVLVRVMACAYVHARVRANVYMVQSRDGETNSNAQKNARSWFVAWSSKHGSALLVKLNRIGVGGYEFVLGRARDR